MKNYLIAACILISAAAAAQQKPQYTQYMINPFVLNPAVSGTEDYADIRAGYRKQWTGFDGSPRTFYLSAHTNIGKNLVVNNRSRNKKNGFHGIGLLATNDVIGATSNTTISGAYSYHLALTKKLFASLGVMGGLQQFALDAGKLNTTNPNDPLINSFNNTALADINTGFWDLFGKIYIGGSLLQLMPQKLYNETNVATNGRLSQHYFIMAGYRIPMGYDFTFIPSFCIKGVSPAPLSYDINAKMRYRDIAWAGVSYRNKDAVAFMVGVIVNNTFDISYSYDYYYEQYPEVQWRFTRSRDRIPVERKRQSDLSIELLVRVSLHSIKKGVQILYAFFVKKEITPLFFLNAGRHGRCCRVAVFFGTAE